MRSAATACSPAAEKPRGPAHSLTRTPRSVISIATTRPANPSRNSGGKRGHNARLMAAATSVDGGALGN